MFKDLESGFYWLHVNGPQGQEVFFADYDDARRYVDLHVTITEHSVVIQRVYLKAGEYELNPFEYTPYYIEPISRPHPYQPPEPWPDAALTVSEISEWMKAFAHSTVLNVKLEGPHSYRGNYECLAFEPHEGSMTLKELRVLLYDSINEEYPGWKGGEYYMTHRSHVYMARVGCTGLPLSTEYLESMLNKK